MLMHKNAWLRSTLPTKSKAAARLPTTRVRREAFLLAGKANGTLRRFQSFGPFYGGYQQQQWQESRQNDPFNPVRQYVNAMRSGSPVRAEPDSKQNRRRYYLSAIANYGVGNVVTASRISTPPLKGSRQLPLPEYTAANQAGTRAYTARSQMFGMPTSA